MLWTYVTSYPRSRSQFRSHAKMTNGTALPMCARWYTVGPQTYMPTFAGGSGSATSDFVEVS